MSNPYTVKAIRAQGIECRWTRTRNGAPIIAALTDTRDRKGERMWMVIDSTVWERAHAVGLKQAIDEASAFLNFFSITA